MRATKRQVRACHPRIQFDLVQKCGAVPRRPEQSSPEAGGLNGYQIVDTSGTFAHFYCFDPSSFPDTGRTVTFTVDKNGVSAGVTTCSISKASTNSSSVSAISLTVAAGDRIDVSVQAEKNGDGTGDPVSW
jgi:hypothetical protein